LPVGRRSQPPFLALNGYELPRLKMTKLSSPLLRPKWAPDRATPMPLVRPPVPLPVLKAARPHKVLQAVPGLAPAPVTLPAPDRPTNPGPVVADLEAAPAQGPVTRPALVPVAVEAAPAVVGTKTRFGGE
jgi:hypothetical protein